MMIMLAPASAPRKLAIAVLVLLLRGVSGGGKVEGTCSVCCGID